MSSTPSSEVVIDLGSSLGSFRARLDYAAIRRLETNPELRLTTLVNAFASRTWALTQMVAVIRETIVSGESDKDRHIPDSDLVGEAVMARGADVFVPKVEELLSSAFSKQAQKAAAAEDGEEEEEALRPGDPTPSSVT